MRISQLSRHTAVSVRMLRYYEEKGLIRPKRRDSGYREYDNSDLQRVRCIRMLNAGGLSLDKILRILPCVLTESPTFEPCPELGAFFRHEIAAIDEQMKALRQSRRVLKEYLETLA